MFDFLKHRSQEEEIMDDFDCAGKVVDQTLKELHDINVYLGGSQISVSGIQKLIKKSRKDSYHILDLGCGGGDTLKLFAKWGLKKKINLELEGIDANTYIIDYANRNTKEHKNIHFLAMDIFSSEFRSMKFDIAHCSLFLHHFSEDSIVTLLKQLHRQAHLGIVINDLHRHPISYYFTKYILTAWSQSKMVKNDSILSVARSFTKKELKSYLAQAGIENFSLQWKWAFRWKLVIYRIKQ